MDPYMNHHYINYAGLVQKTQSIRDSLDAIYPESMSLTIKRIRAIQDGLISHEESDLLKEYSIITGG